MAARFRERGVPVIDADQLAREVVARGTDGLRAIVAAFGDGVLDGEGTLDRKALAAIVFDDVEARRTIERITHPRVAALAATRTAELDARGEALACYEVPLLFEGRLADLLRPVVVVVVPEATQIARTVLRDGCSEAEARARVRAQMPLADKAKLADHVIDNAGSRETALATADAVLDAICASLAVPAERYPRP